MTDPGSDRYSWRLVEPGRPLVLSEGAARPPEPGEVVIEIAGCGFCHTDIGFIEGHVNTRSELPLVLGHEISGTVVESGDGADTWMGKDVLVSAVIACGQCDMCAAGRGNVCRNQKLPGNDLDGGFATHVTVPASGLSAIDSLPAGYELADFAVIADAVTTPLQAVRRAGVSPGDFAIVVGTGGVGTYAAQIATASGAVVIGVDINDNRLEPLLEHGGLAAAVNSRGMMPREVRERIRELAHSQGLGRTGWKIFECSGTAAGQSTAFGLLDTAATLAVVGFTRDMIEVRLSNLMAFDATAFGSWGCPPERYPEAIELVASNRVTLLPYIRRVRMSEIAAVIADAQRGDDPRRAILVP